MLKLVKTIRLKNVKLKPVKSHSCFMYDLKSLGLNAEEIASSLGEMYMDIFEFSSKRTLSIVKMQKELYSQLLRRVKSNKMNYFAHAFLFGASCQFCPNPSVEGRSGMCALPESARNKMRSLKLLGFSAYGFNPKWLDNEFMCGVAYAKKESNRLE